MVELKKDNKAKIETWIITTTDSEGFHRQINISEKDMYSLFFQWSELKLESFKKEYRRKQEQYKKRFKK